MRLVNQTSEADPSGKYLIPKHICCSHASGSLCLKYQGVKLLPLGRTCWILIICPFPTFRDHFTVQVPLPRLVFQILPEEIREGKPLRIFPMLFNVGINEQQTIAERSCFIYSKSVHNAWSDADVQNPEAIMLHRGHAFLILLLRFGDISLQERINQKNFEILEAYYKLLSEKMPTECKFFPHCSSYFPQYWLCNLWSHKMGLNLTTLKSLNHEHCQ